MEVVSIACYTLLKSGSIFSYFPNSRPGIFRSRVSLWHAKSWISSLHLGSIFSFPQMGSVSLWDFLSDGGKLYGFEWEMYNIGFRVWTLSPWSMLCLRRFKYCSLFRGSLALRALGPAFEIKSLNHFQFILSASCICLKMWALGCLFLLP